MALSSLCCAADTNIGRITGADLGAGNIVAMDTSKELINDKAQLIIFGFHYPVFARALIFFDH